MNQNIQSKLEGYLELFEEIKSRVKDDILARTILGEVSKDRRMEQIREEREMKNGDSATIAQRRLMTELGMEIPPGVTRKEASARLTERLERGKE